MRYGLMKISYSWMQNMCLGNRLAANFLGDDLHGAGLKALSNDQKPTRKRLVIG